MMEAFPSFDEFAAAYQAGRPQVVWTQLIADLETPVSAMIKIADGRPYSFLLESVEGGLSLGRYSFIGLKPDLIWRCRSAEAEINRRPESDPDGFEPCAEAPLDSLRKLLIENRIDLPTNLPPMAAGLFGYLAYDMVRLMERLPDGNPDPIGIPDSVLLRPTIVVVFDNVARNATIVTPVRPSPAVEARTAYDRACRELTEIRADFQRPLPYRSEPPAGLSSMPTASNTTEAEYHEMVERAKEYIRAGDAFQVVPSQRFSVPFPLPPLSLYRALRRLNPSPFLFFLDFDDFAIVGSSPEILVRLRDGIVTIRPVAGTRPRGATPEEDRDLAEDLLSDPKERAEHLMLLDLGRNDVGRVAKIGTVQVKEQFVIENYSHVMHIASHVEGEIRPDLDALDALIAGFPAGTVSGAPKVRAMEIIDELEKARRGVYAGCVGYFGANGAMDTCIALRTAIVKDNVMYVQAGGGVVADSDPRAEYQETVNKARALIRAAEDAIRVANEGS
jgi:anthranilate synthase component 1